MKKGDQFLKLLESASDSLLQELTHTTYDREDARDLFQDTVLLAYEHFDELRDKEAFPAWIRAIARSAVAAKYRRKMSREIPMDTGAPELDEARLLTFNDDAPQDPLDEVLRRLDIQEMREFVSELGYTARVFVHMRYEQELSMKEIAAELGTSPGYLAVLHHRIKEKLRKRSEETDEP